MLHRIAIIYLSCLVMGHDPYFRLLNNIVEKNQLDRLAPVACRNAPPPPIGVILHEEVYQLFIKTRQDSMIVGII